MPAVTRESAARWGLGLAVLAAFAVLVVRCAWVSDDAYITLRTVDNLLNGYGLRWNVIERVQAYTHPLWMLLLIVPHALTGEAYHGTLALSVGTSVAAMAVLWFGVARTPWAGLAAAVPLLMSRAYIDFSTSGLENPLSHLLLACLVLSVARGGGSSGALVRTACLALSGFLVRPDLVLLTFPLLFVHLWEVGPSRRAAVALAVGGLPVLVWELFSFVYYGSFVPNTAYAKLGAGIPRADLLLQGLDYLAWTGLNDPITGVAIGVAALAVLGTRTPDGIALIAGATSYLAYVVWVGGDFMGGRFLTPVLLVSLLAVARLELGPWLGIGAASLALTIALPNPYAPVWSGERFERPDARRGVIDERGYYHRGAGLMSAKDPVSHGFAREGRLARADGPHTVVRATIGYFGYFAGPEVHVIDRLALADPLLARLPARYDPTWRIGHFRRDVPLGYDPRIDAPPDDPALAAVEARVREVVRGPLFDPGRLQTALSLAWSGVELDPWPLRFPDLTVTEPDAPFQPRRVDEGGLAIPVAPPRVLTPTIEGAEGTSWRALYVRDREVLTWHRVQGGGPVRLPASPGPVDQLLLFPESRTHAWELRAVDLGARAR